jgi:protein TonB
MRIRKILPALLGVIITFLLVMLMYQLIDSSDIEIDEQSPVKIPTTVHKDREITENVKSFEVEKLAKPVVPPVTPDLDNDIEVPDTTVVITGPRPNPVVEIDTPVQRAYIPVYVPQPQYPRRAQTQGKEGYAVIAVTITTVGDVRDPIMVEEFPEGWGFGKAALRAAGKLKYSPKVVDGVPQEVSGVLYKFTFKMAK